MKLDRSLRRGATLAVTLSLLATACSDDTTSTSPSTASSRGSASEGQVLPGSLEGVAIRLEPVAELEQPVAMSARAGTTDLYVAEQTGAIRRLVATDDGSGLDVDDAPTLDLTDETRARGEQGLLGLAFSPDGSRLYVNYTDRSGDTHIVEYTMDGERADAGTARELLLVEQPYPNHNGGQLAFGPDGYLYVALGDGGSRDDPERRAQDLDTLLGKILRIDPLGGDGDEPYAIPDDNPYASGEGRPEIWIHGARNPWRFSFDRETDDLWVADVGQNTTEEINWLAAANGSGRGVNLGWPLREGSADYLDTPVEGLTDPIFEYGREDGNCSVIGGYVYRGSAIPDLTGTYVYGDYCRSEIRGLLTDLGQVLDERGLGVSVSGNSLTSFGEGADGEIYVLSATGTVYRIEPA